MRSASKALLLLVVISVAGAWGCSQGGVPNSARVRDLEARHAKLEEDYRGTLAARDEARRKLTAAEQERARLRQQVADLDAAARERDALRQQVAKLTSERDGLQGNLQQFVRDLQGLINRAEAAANPSHNPPLTSALAGPQLPGS